MSPEREPPRNRAVFLDRDGVIIEDSGYIGEISRVKFLSGIGPAVRQLNAEGFKVIIVTNQAGVARGYFNEAAVNAVNNYIRQKLGEEKAVIDGIYYCPHHIEGVIEKYSKECNCRKPKIGMIELAVKDFRVDIKKSFLIGDKDSDIEAGRRAGCRTIMIDGAGKEPAANADYTAGNLRQAVKWLLKLAGENNGKN